MPQHKYAPPRNPSKHPDRAASKFGIVHPIELIRKRTENLPGEALAASQRAHTYPNVFQHLPGNPPQHHVLGTVLDGRKARVCDVELVWNDMLFIDHCFGQGAYKAMCPEPEKELLDIAERLYRGRMIMVN